jgi:hypothetical protein
MSDVIYTSKVHIERKAAPLRIAKLPGEPQPVVFSVHGARAAKAIPTECGRNPAGKAGGSGSTAAAPEADDAVRGSQPAKQHEIGNSSAQRRAG